MRSYPTVESLVAWWVYCVQILHVADITLALGGSVDFCTVSHREFEVQSLNIFVHIKKNEPFELGVTLESSFSQQRITLRVLLSRVISRVIFNLLLDILFTVLKKTILLVNSHAAILTY